MVTSIFNLIEDLRICAVTHNMKYIPNQVYKLRSMHIGAWMIISNIEWNNNNIIISIERESNALIKSFSVMPYQTDWVLGEN